MVTKKGSFVSADTQTMMHEGIKDLPIWQNKYFWEAAFFESVARERQNLADEYKVGHLNHLKWDDLSSDLQSLYTTKEADLLFGVLGRNFLLSLSPFQFLRMFSPLLPFTSPSLFLFRILSIPPFFTFLFFPAPLPLPIATLSPLYPFYFIQSL